MKPRAIAFAFGLIIAGSAPGVAPAFAQFIPPHSNDPHPPANQPAYQLPSPLSRPGLPQYPGAAHSNDPYYTKTEPTRAPTLIPPSAAPYPSVSREQLRQPWRYSTQPVAVERGKKPVKKSVSLAQCYKKWDPGLSVTRASWEQNCRRLASAGRVRS